MVDIVARVVVEDDGERTLNFKSNEYIFGGGRLKGLHETKIPLSWDALMEVYDIASKPSQRKEVVEDEEPKQKVEVEQEVEEVEQELQEEAPRRRRRKARA